MAARIYVFDRRLAGRQRAFVIALNAAALSGPALAAWQLVQDGWSVTGLSSLLIMYILASGLGISVGYHRLFSHRSFLAPPAMRAFLAICGSMAGQGPVVYWTATHRCHHQFSDRSDDPHAPGNARGQGFWGRFWHSHLGWLLGGRMVNSALFAPDLMKDRLLARINRWYPLWMALGLALPAIAVLGLGGTFGQAFTAFIWGGPLRLFFGLQFSYLVNSLCHLAGGRRYLTSDQSRNQPLLALVTFGEAWHNNHHASPRAANFGRGLWFLDPGYVSLLAFSRLGWVRLTPVQER